MIELSKRIDDALERFCVWLNDFFPGDRRLAFVGHAIAGVGSPRPLPIDRRLAPSVLLMAHTNGGDMAYGARAKGGTGNQTSCGFWAYCHMSGQPCVWCAGKNSVDGRATDQEAVGRTACPAGKIPGAAWYGCCRDPAGRLKLIAFLDCCGHGFCAGLSRCNNWPEAKNWCFFDGQSSHIGARGYYCTISIWVGDCS